MKWNKGFFVNRLNKKTVFLISICVVAFAVLFTAAYLFFFSKPAKQFYLESEGRNFKKYSDQIKQIYADFYSAQKPYMEGSYKKRLEITANINSGEAKLFGAANSQGIIDIINKCKIVVDSKNNPVTDLSLTNIALLLEKAPILDTTVIKRDKQLGFTVPVVLPDKYFILDTDKLDEVYDRYYKRYGLLPIRPKRVLSSVDLAKTVKFSDTELDGIAKDYGAFIASLIEPKDVKYGRNVTVKIGDEVIKGREIAVSLDSVQTKKLVEGFIDKMSVDATMLKLTYENYADIIKMLDEAGVFQTLKVFDEQGYLKLNSNFKDLLDTLNKTKDIPGFKAGLKEILSNIEYPGGLKMTVCIDSSGNILSRRVDLSLTSKDNSSYVINIDTGTNSTKFDNFKTGICNLKITSTKNGNTFTSEYGVNSSVLSAGKNENGKVLISYTGKKNSAVEFSTQVNLDVSRNLDELTMKMNSSVKYDIKWKTDKNAAGGDLISGELSSVSWKNNKLKTKDDNLSLTVKLDTPSWGINNTSIKLGLNREDKFDIGEIQLPELVEANTINLNTISDKELEKVEDSVTASFGTFYLKNKPIVDAVMGD